MAPATTSAGASTRGVTGRSPEQHFFLEDPGATTTATTRSAPRGAATSPSGTAPTISKSSLKAKIAEIENGITSDAYRECVLGKHRVVRYARYLEASGKRFGLTFEHDLRSGAAAGTEAIYPHRFMSRSDSIGREWLVGPDKDLFTARQERVYSTRPLPQGEYKVFYNWRPVGWVDCPPYPKEALEYDEFRVTVVAPGGTLAESFFDPYAAGGAVTGTTTVGTISWQSGRVTADLTVDATGHALDFIGLDGTTTLSLIVADATETDGTLTWTVPTQPWSAGDKLMLRVRRHDAPTPTPTPTADGYAHTHTATPTPTPTPTPIPTDRPVVLFLDSLDASVLDSLEMAVGEVFWVSVKALNLSRSASYTIELTRVNDEPAGGVGIVFHYQACGYTPQSIRVSSGNTSYARTMAVKLCTGTGGTVTAVLKRGNATLATTDLEVSTPP